MRFRPTLHDDNAEFECHATNIALPEEIGTVRDSIRIRVQRTYLSLVIKVFYKQILN
mgnify:CR=1 FL=1